MQSEKLIQNQKKTAKRLEKEAELARHQDELDKLGQIRETQLETTKILIRFLNGKTTKTEVINQLKEVGTPDVKKVVVAIEKLTKKVDEKAVDISPMTALLEKVVAELEKKPNELPEAPEQVEVDFTSTNGKLDELIAAFKDSAREVIVKAPDVNVAAPKTTVKVEKLDVSSLVQPLVDAVTAIREYSAPEFIPTDLTTVEELLTTANKLLEKIEKKKVGGGGGGGGGMVPFKDPETGFSVQVDVEADGSIPTTAKTWDIKNISPPDDPEILTYKYFGFTKRGSTVWRIMRKTLATKVFEYAYGDTGYAAAWTDKDGQF